MRHAMLGVLTGVVGITALAAMGGPSSHAHAVSAATAASAVGTQYNGLATSSTLLDATTGQDCGRTVGEHCVLAASGAIGVLRGVANLGTFSLTLKIDFTSYNDPNACGTVETGSQVVITKSSLDAATLSVDPGAVCVQPQDPGGPLPFAQNLTYDNGAGGVDVQPGDRLPGPGSVRLQVYSPNPLTFTPASSDSATTGDPSISAQARIANLSAAAASGTGTVTVAAYTANPTGVALTAASAGAFFDVKVALGSTFGSVAVVRCGASATDKVYWFDGQVWHAVSPQSYDAATGCVTMNLDNTSSSPTIAQLTGTPFAIGSPAPTSRPTALTLLSSAPLGSVVGQSVTVTATVTTAGAGAAAPGGTVTFYDGGTVLGAGALTGGQAAFTTSSLGVGAHPITATYSGDANDLGSVAPLLSQQVNRDSTTTALTSAPNPSTIGQAVTFTATVAVAAPGAAAPAGQLTFLDGSATLGTGTLNSAGVATFTTTLLSVGMHSVTAVYGGDANDSASASAAVSQRVAPKPLQLVLSVTTSPSGPVTTGSVVTVNGALTNHTAAAQSVTLKAALVYVSGHTGGAASVSNVSLQLAPGQTVGRTFSFRVQSSYPRGPYTLTLTATDAGGDTDSGVASLTIV